MVAASVLAAGCLSSSYTIPNSELRRLATLPPDQRGQHVRVVQLVNDADVGPRHPVTEQTEVVFVPNIDLGDPGPGRPRRWGHGIGGGSGNVNLPAARSSGGHGGLSGLHGGGSGGDGKAEAIEILIAAAVILVVAASIEGTRYDGYVQMHPMQPVYLLGKDGSRAEMPLAWIDPEAAAFTEKAVVRSDEGPWRELGRAPLDRQGFTYAMFGGVGTYTSIDGSTDSGTATTLQLGYFPDPRIGVLGTMFFGWRDNSSGDTLFESRYALELDAYPVQVGVLHLGLYGGGGAAYRWEDYNGVTGAGDASSLALLGGGLVQLDVNTRLALTARAGVTNVHGENTSDVLIGLSVY